MKCVVASLKCNRTCDAVVVSVWQIDDRHLLLDVPCTYAPQTRFCFRVLVEVYQYFIFITLLFF